MNRVFLLAFLAIITKCAIGQWTTSGTDIYSSNTGNVGVGTTSPSTKLEVSGEIKQTGRTTYLWGAGSNQNQALMFAGWGVAHGGIYWRGDTRTFTLNTGNDADNLGQYGNANFVVTGNVGIGVTNPSQKLVIDAGASNGGIQLQSTAGQNIIRYYQTDAGTNLKVLQQGIYGGKGFISGINDAFNAETYRFLTFDLSNGNVGVGTTNPSGALEVLKGSTRIQMAANGTGLGDVFRIFGLNGSGFSVNSLVPSSGNLITDLGVNYSVDGGNGISPYALIGTKKSPILRFNAEDGSIGLYGENGSGSDYRTPVFNLGLYVNGSGNVGVGTTNDHGYKLAVNGNVLAQKIRITQTGWPDYVFHSTYKLLSLKELESYIQKNNHLPEIPSSNEIEKNGLDLGDNQAALLKKIEELTLYIIDQNKTIVSQQNQIGAEHQELLELKKELEIIKTKLQINN